ncbi:MAG TPA: deoxyguanosinetriphosphate triphosphohydrolase [Leptospiraceae bacterium]|nr:deoxyguanosinetriphosphate triphosphohydrolase [Leptospiraceae bacterium]HNE09412.1 deoxyguanosinetriphosphate triphosphohydrolase [Leptospiraceae bacterium]HNH02893.1 deoxyguanosinetriphosphate triphosphohydrolase [Leptospiraceae bacterium]HNI90195.1 deoxyguanosinetriphosphate triphosphohydrolase [Leptospiraceae bacterium]HNK57962.1 deoxyguanosinetriphosphate triphosphohydrolase [Leptospiraceae bacterium]
MLPIKAILQAINFMIKTIDELYIAEDSRIADYGVKHYESRERVYEEKGHAFRLPLQRDRDRIYHSRFFKRLQYKTQVFTNSEGDNFRTRLTHTLEVSGIARSIATNLGLNSLLAECIALAHDLGHAPFGHAGQDILSDLMKGNGGFEHNKQSLRIVQVLENRYPEFPGINLCKVTLSGIMKHGGDYAKSELNSLRLQEGPSLESLITDISDEIAYTCHDIEDGLEMEYITMESLMYVSLWKEMYLISKEKYKDATKDLLARATIRGILNFLVTDLTTTTEENLKKHQIKNFNDLKLAWRNKFEIADFSKETEPRLRELKKFLLDNLYHHEMVIQMSRRGQGIIEKLFHYYIKHTEEIPENYRRRMEEDGKYRAVCDYISGMTDRYAQIQVDSIS